MCRVKMIDKSAILNSGFFCDKGDQKMSSQSEAIEEYNQISEEEQEAFG